MSTKYLYEQKKALHEVAPETFPLDDEKVWVQRATNQLIAYLFRPDREHKWGWVADGPLIELLGFRDEPINYGDLSCVDVQRLGDDGFLVLIEEAAPSCPNFCAWVEGWLAVFGWKTQVETEW